MDSLSLTFRIRKGFPELTRAGFNFFTRLLFFDSLPNTLDDFPQRLTMLEGNSKQVLQASSFFTDIELDNEAQASKVSEILDQIKKHHTNTQEYWAAKTLDLVALVRESIEEKNALDTAVATAYLENANFMLLFKQFFFEDTIWLGHAVTKLEELLETWSTNKDNDDESFWQTQFSENSLLLSQLFSFPVIVLKDKAYVGGKGIDNKGGNLVDFLLKNRLSQNTALIEIKNPKTQLLGSKYRSSIYSVSQELTGAINQVINYKDSLLKSYHSVAQDHEYDFYAFNPKCLVVAGTIENEITDQARRRSFELFRNELRNAEVITYDELFDKVKILVDLFLNVES